MKAILFDLDGTLLDTATDLGSALNSLLTTYSLPPLALSQTRTEAGRGCKGLLKAGFNIDEHHSSYAKLCEELLAYYQHHLFDTTNLFPGMPEVLAHLEKSNIPWGIVTNKPEKFTLQLVEKLHPLNKAVCVISGDTLEKRKPHPEPILHACKLLGEKPEDCLYIGDAEIDVIASKAAGTVSLVALYGYIAAHENPKNWQATGYIEHPAEIIGHL